MFMTLSASSSGTISATQAGRLPRPRRKLRQYCWKWPRGGHTWSRFNRGLRRLTVVSFVRRNFHTRLCFWSTGWQRHYIGHYSSILYKLWKRNQRHCWIWTPSLQKSESMWPRGITSRVFDKLILKIHLHAVFHYACYAAGSLFPLLMKVASKGPTKGVLISNCRYFVGSVGFCLKCRQLLKLFWNCAVHFWGMNPAIYLSFIFLQSL